MAVRHEVPSDLQISDRSLPTTGWREIAETVAVVAGAIAAFAGLFILLGGEDQYLGLSGDLSWRVSDVPSAWAFGLLASGLVLLLGVAVSVVLRRRRT